MPYSKYSSYAKPYNLSRSRRSYSKTGNRRTTSTNMNKLMALSSLLRKLKSSGGNGAGKRYYPSYPSYKRKAPASSKSSSYYRKRRY